MGRVSIPGVCERDIDFLLQEEFASASGFLEWFLQKVGGPEGASLSLIEHSVSTATGESDLELTVRFGEGLHKYLIENKIDAPLQPRQAERYRERADRYREEGIVPECRTVLVAPRKYVEDEEGWLGFDSFVAYEELLAWFEEEGRLGDRGLFKRALLSRAIDRGSSPWKMVPDEKATEFWSRYWELAQSLAPELRMPRPKVKPARSSFIYFRPSSLPKGVTIVHKTPYGRVDIQFAGAGGRMNDLAEKYGSSLQPGMSMEAAGKSAVIRFDVPEIDLRGPFSDNEPLVREGIWAAKLLHAWYCGVEKG